MTAQGKTFVPDLSSVIERKPTVRVLRLEISIIRFLSNF